MSGDNLHGKQPIKFYSEKITLTKVELLERQLSLGEKISDLEEKHKEWSRKLSGWLIIELFFYKHINTTKKLSYKVKEYYYSKLSNVKKFNLDYETFFLEFKDKLLSE